MAAVDAATVAELLTAGSASADSSTFDKVVALLSLVVSTMAVGDVQLRAVAWGNASTLACDDAPLVIAKTESPNGACPDAWVNASCMCLSELMGATSWRVPVSLADAAVANDLPTETSGVANVTSINRFFVPTDLQALALEGQGETPVDVDVETTGLSSIIKGFIVPLGASSLRSIEVTNISMASATIDANFVPSTITNMTMQNCGLTALSSDVFAGRHDSLQFLDLSVNSLSTLSLGLADATTSSTIRFVNLSYNSLTAIPSDIFSLNQLDQLDLRGNPISDFSVSDTEFELLARLSVFEIDAPDTSTTACASGNWTAVHDSPVCVIATSSASSSAATTSESAGTTPAVYGGIGGGVAFVLLVVIGVVAWRVRARRLKETADVEKHGYTSSMDDNSTLSRDMSALTGADGLLLNPLIVMNRLPIEDVVIEDSISKGGFGEVFVGYYLGRRVAVKKIHPYHQSDPRRVEMFLREIILMASLQHPRIVEFVGVAWSSLRHLMAVTEFMEQGDLRDVMLHYKRLRESAENTNYGRTSVLFSGLRNSMARSSIESATALLSWESHKLKWAMQIVEALVYLHSLEPVVVHRDLKSKNVLVDGALNAKLSDFGISRERTVEDTHMTTGVGTSFWIAPEVLMGGRYNEKADVFSFGIVLSELDTEDYPYWNVKKREQDGEGGGEGGGDGGGNGSPVLHQHVILSMVASGDIRPTFSADCPLGILQIAEQCLHGDPNRRPTSAMVFHMLQQLLYEPQPLARLGGEQMSPSTSPSADDSLY